MKTQAVVIHGGETFKTYNEYLTFLEGLSLDFDEEYGVQKRGWRTRLPEELGEGFEVILLRMPSKLNAKYVEWKIWFDKHIPFLKNDLIFVGHSLGGLFLAKYLSEEEIPVALSATFLVAAPFSEEGLEGSLADFVLPKSLDKFREQSERIFIMHSEDDFVVPFEHSLKYREYLPNAQHIAFKDKGHFLQESFPELVQRVKEITT